MKAIDSILQSFLSCYHREAVQASTYTYIVRMCVPEWIIRILVWSDKCQSKQEVGRSSADIDQTL